MENPAQNQGQNASVKSSGKTVDEAIENGLSQLNLTREQVDIEVLKQGSRGILGIGAENAEVLLTPKIDESVAVEEVSAPPEVVPVAVDVVADTEDVALVDAPSTSDDAPPVGDDGIDVATKERAKTILADLLENMSVTANVDYRMGHDIVEPGERIPLVLDITGPDLGLLIGRRGETLRSLQFVTRQILNKEMGRWVPVVIDVESYLVRRRKSLQQLADRMAERVVFSGRRVVLEPMPPQERRIIHLQLRDHQDVYTKSMGEGDKRKVAILPK